MSPTDGNESRPRRKKKGKHSWLFRLLIVAFVLLLPVLVAVGGLVGIFYYYGNDPSLPSLGGIGDYRPEQIIKVLDREGKPIGEIGAVHRTVVPYDKIPKMMIKALLAAEDAEYFEHEGIDYKGMARAFVENVLRRKFAQGASTITQQVVKQLLLSPEKSMRRKVQEIILDAALLGRGGAADVVGRQADVAAPGAQQNPCPLRIERLPSPRPEGLQPELVRVEPVVHRLERRHLL